MQNKDLGFKKEQIVVANMPRDTNFVKNLATFKQEFLKNPNILQVGSSNSIPGEGYGRLTHSLEANGKEITKTFNILTVDEHFFQILEIPILEGRGFSKDIQADVTQSIIINETAVRDLGWDNPIGKKLVNDSRPTGKIVGVVKDFHYTSLQSPLEPLVIMYTPKPNYYLLFKIRSQNVAQTLDFLAQTWQNLGIIHPLEYTFLDDNFNQLYAKEQKMLLIFGYFTILTILISCLGLFGLASFTTEQRTKEIGIRKVLGASTYHLTKLISKDFILLVLVANLIAIPVAFYFMSAWLHDFAHRIDLGWMPFFLAGGLALLIALVTVSAIALRAALNNPIEVLKYE